MPVVLLFLSLTVDIGNWWVHKRHLQLQADAAALAGGAFLGDCFSDPSAAKHAIQNEATRFGGGAGSSYNGQVGGANKGTITLLYQSTTYAAGSVGRTTPRRRPPCETPSLMFDVKATEAGLPLHLPDSGPPQRRRDQRARACAAEAGRGAGRDAARRRARPPLHVRVRDVRQRGQRRLSRDGGAEEDRHERQRPALGDPARSRLDRLGARRRPDPARRRLRSEAACGTLYTECYDAGSTNGVVHIRGWSTATAPAARNAWLLPGTCAPDAYFAKGDCSGGIQAEVDLGATHPLTGAGVTAKVWATSTAAATTR